jgi:2-polyprenyl-3-methyl-5-hydroxy-6-metoxy-1,4-benzoquinol methylase
MIKKMSKPSLVNKQLSEKYPHDYYDDRIKTAITMISEKKNPKYLDIGCSNGKITSIFAKNIGAKEYYGVDLANIKNARLNGVKAVEFDLNEDNPLPFKPKTFDVITNFDTLEHIYNTDHCVREMGRILKDDGYIIVIVPRTDSLMNIVLLILGYQMTSGSCSLERNYANFSNNRISAHMSHFTKRDLIKMFQYHGYKIDMYNEASIMGAWIGDQKALGKKPSSFKKILFTLFSLVPFKKEACIIRISKMPGVLV